MPSEKTEHYHQDKFYFKNCLELEMENQRQDERDKRAKSYSTMRSILDYTMGLLYLSAAAFLFFAERFGFEMDNFDITFRYIFGGLCALYGFWRIYRGFKKDYF